MTDQRFKNINPEHLDDVIGLDNYDLGILFSYTGSDLGGQAAVAEVCTGKLKAAAIADFNTPVFMKNRWNYY